MIPQVQPLNYGGETSPSSFVDAILLLHLNGANAGVSFPDNSSFARTATKVGTVTTSTAQSIYNGSSGLYSGTSSYLEFPASTDFNFGSGDFTIQAAVRPTTTAAVQTIITNRAVPASDVGWFFYLFNNQLGFLAWSSPFVECINLVGGSVPINTWAQVAVRKLGSMTTLWVNAVEVAHSVYTGSIANSAGKIWVGGDGASTSPVLVANLAEMRVVRNALG